MQNGHSQQSHLRACDCGPFHAELKYAVSLYPTAKIMIYMPRSIYSQVLDNFHRSLL